MCVFVCGAKGVNLFVSVLQQVQGNPFYYGQLRTSTHIVHHQWRRKSCKTQNTSGSELAAGGCERRGGGVLCVRVCVGGSTQRITMVTAIRGLRGVRLGQRGRLERQLTEESALTLDDSTDSSPRGLCRTSRPQRPRALQNRDVASSPLLKEKKKHELNPRQYNSAITHRFCW